jgi:RNA polymerase sigma-70 factor (ECF subfamily)
MSAHSPGDGHGSSSADDTRHVSRGPQTDKASAAAEVERIFREEGAFVWRALRRLGVASGDVDDACQEVFVVVYRKLDEWEGRGQLRSWLYGITIRVAAAHRRKAHQRYEIPTEEPVGPDEASAMNPEGAAADREALVLLDRALDELDDDRRAVFVLYEIEGLEMPEIAEAVACPLQTAYSRLHSARKEVERSMKRAALGKVAP